MREGSPLRYAPLGLAAVGTLAAGLLWGLAATPDSAAAATREHRLLFLALWGAVTCLALAWPPLRERRLPILALAVVAALGACHVLAHEGKSAEIQGQRYWWLDDDMMISARYARNLAAGEGLVWNAGERVEGYTNLLWTLVLAVPHLFLPPETVSFAVILLNTGILLLLLLAVNQVLAEAGVSGFAAGVGCLLIATSPSALNWTVGGGEAVLLGFLLVLLGRAAGRAIRGWKGALGLGLLAGAIVLVRPDAAVASGCLLLGALARKDNRRLVPVLVGGAVLLPVLQVAFRLMYYGEWLPNTWYLKGTGWDLRGEAGWLYVKALLLDHYPLLLLAVVGTLFQRRHWPWLLAILGHLLYVARVGGDELPEQRFFLPILPLVAVLAVEGAVGLAAAVNDKVLGGARPVLLPALLLVWTAFHGAVLPGTIPPAMAIRSGAEHRNVLVGLMVRANTEPDAVVAHFWAGAAPYFSERRGLDLFGKCDPWVARTEAHEGIRKAGHAKYDLDHSLGLRPDVVVGGDPGALPPAMVAQRAQSDYRAFAHLMQHPEFLAHYLAGLVRQPLSLQWHGVYVRDDTTKARPASEWR